MASDDWRIVVPRFALNLIQNPIAGDTSGYAAAGSATVTRDTTQSRYGRYSYKIVGTGDGDGVTLDIQGTITTGTYYYLTVLALTSGLPTVEVNYTSPLALSTIETWGDWTLLGAEINGTTYNGETTIPLAQSGAGTPTWYVAAVQVEELAATGDPYTTFIHGDMAGNYGWTGAPHNSASYRGAFEYSGGVPKPLGDGTAPVTGFSIIVNREYGAGASPLIVNAQPQALIDGDLTTGVNVLPRTFAIGGRINSTDKSDWHSKRRALIRALDNRLSDTEHTPRRLQYIGNGELLEIDAYYESGLEGAAAVDSRDSNKVTVEDLEMRLKASDPMFKAAGEQAYTVTVEDSATHRTLSAYVPVIDTVNFDRDRRYRGWVGGGTFQVAPSALGTYTDMRAILKASDGYTWMGGDWTNFDNDANADYYVRWLPADYSAPFDTPFAGFNNVVRAIAEGEDGEIYFGGDFTTGGGGSCNYYGLWNGSALTNVRAPSSGGATVRGIAVTANGDQWVGGDFTNWDATSANYITYWDQSASTWVRPSSNDPSALVRAVVVDSSDNVYIGGDFTTAGGVTVNYVAKWNGSDWEALASGVDGSVYALAVDPAGNVYAAVNTSDPATLIKKFNGTSWETLGGFSYSTVQTYALKYHNGKLYAGGDFTTAGDYTVDGLAVWNGSEWLPLDIDFGGGTVYAIEADGDDLYIGHDTVGTVKFSDVTVTPESYSGTGYAYPTIYISRSGGTSARLVQFRNEQTGATLYFDYDLIDGEELVIDTRPNNVSVTSNLFGNKFSALGNSSDIGRFHLVPGPDGDYNNLITGFVDNNGATLTAYMTYREAYNGTD